MSRPTVLIAYDHLLVAEGLQRLVEREFRCVGIISRGGAVLKTAEQLMPDLILLDLSIPEIDGLEITRRICRGLPQSKVFIISMSGSQEDVRRALATGASGYLSKECASTQLLVGMREVLRGGTYVSVQSLNAGPAAAAEASRAIPSITPRQQEVLELVVRGLSAKTIAHHLSISQKTVEFHKTTMMRTLALRNTAELIRFAVEHRLINLAPFNGRSNGGAMSADTNAV